MSNLSANIPEIFYDLISRVLPGVTITAGVLILLVLSSTITLGIHLIDFVTSVNFLFLVLVVAYLSGSLLGTVSQALDVVFRYSYNPATDYLKIKNTKTIGKTIAHFVEIALGLPFSVFLWNEYRPEVDDDHISEIKALIQKRFGEHVLESHRNYFSCRDYIRESEKESGNIVMKMTAESAMCRNLVVVFLILMFISVYFSLESAVFINALLCTLSFANFSYRRRYYVTQTYNFYFALEKRRLEILKHSIPRKKIWWKFW